MDGGGERRIVTSSCWVGARASVLPPACSPFLTPPNHSIKQLTKKQQQEHLILVSELLKDNLYEYGKFLKETGQASYFTLPRIRLIASQCLEALSFIHSLGLMHCDIKVVCKRNTKRGGITHAGKPSVSSKHQPIDPFILPSPCLRLVHPNQTHIAHLHSHPPQHTHNTETQPENIVIKSYSRVQVKIIDFGSSCFQTDHLTSYIQVGRHENEPTV